MWHEAERDKPDKSGYYICMLECSGRHGCGKSCRDMLLMHYDARFETATVYGAKCMFHGLALYDVPVGRADADVCGSITHWQELPERP